MDGAQSEDVELGRVDPDDGADGVVFVRRRDRTDLAVPASGEERVEELAVATERRVVGEVVDDD